MRWRLVYALIYPTYTDICWSWCLKTEPEPAWRDCCLREEPELRLISYMYIGTLAALNALKTEDWYHTCILVLLLRWMRWSWRLRGKKNPNSRESLSFLCSWPINLCISFTVSWRIPIVELYCDISIDKDLEIELSKDCALLHVLNHCFHYAFEKCSCVLLLHGIEMEVALLAVLRMEQ